MSSLALSSRKAAIALALGAGFAAAGWALGVAEPRTAGVLLAFVLAWAAMVDIDRYVLPNLLTLGLVVTGLGLAALEGWARLLECAIGAVAGYAALAVVAWLFRVLLGKEGLGAGDWKLFAAAGAWLGWADLPQVMLIATVSALVVIGGISLARRKRSGPAYNAFGPFLAIAFWLVWTTGGVPWLVSPMQ